VRDWAPELGVYFKPKRLKGLRLGVFSEDWQVWLEVLLSWAITSILAWESGRDFINQNYINPGMGEWPGLYQSVFRRDCTWRTIYHYNFGKNITIKFGFSLISGGPSFVRQKCSFCRDLKIVATSKSAR
jgi:hypothetical protein